MITLYKIITSVFKETPSYEEATVNSELPIKKAWGKKLRTASIKNQQETEAFDLTAHK